MPRPAKKRYVHKEQSIARVRAATFCDIDNVLDGRLHLNTLRGASAAISLGLTFCAASLSLASAMDRRGPGSAPSNLQPAIGGARHRHPKDLPQQESRWVQRLCPDAGAGKRGDTIFDKPDTPVDE
jgi:hypothetical protein